MHSVTLFCEIAAKLPAVAELLLRNEPMLPSPPALSSMPRRPPSFAWFLIAVIVGASQFGIALPAKSWV